MSACQDILRSVLSVSGLGLEVGEAWRHYVLMEVWRGVSQMLQPDTPILALWSSWAEERPNVCFVVKRIRNPRTGDVTRASASELAPVNRLERIRAEVSQSSEATRPVECQPVRPRPERRLLRRGSSVTRAKRPPDTLHPSLVRSRGEMVSQIETSVRDLVRKSEKLKAEIGKFEQLKQGDISISSKSNDPYNVKQDPAPPDTSDSGIVTDDSEPAMGFRKKFYSRNHYEEPWKLSKELKIKSLDSPDRIEQELSKIESINSKLEKKEEQIVALNFEFNTLSESRNSSPSDVVIINSFISEVTRLQDVNSGHLQEITKNRDMIERCSDDKKQRSKMVNQLEFDINMIEKEGAKLQRSLNQLRLVELPKPLDLEYSMYSNKSDCDNVKSSSESINLIPLPVRKINVTPVKIKEGNTELPNPYLVSPSTLV